MCGIFTVFGLQSPDAFRLRATQLAKKIRHRGPDWSGIIATKTSVICHERLAIVGINSGAQPLTNEDESVILTVNGEIYNHIALRKMLKKNHSFKTNSDCEVLLYLWEEMGVAMMPLIDGMFSFVLHDLNKDVYVACRDHVGITTLYQGWRSSDSTIWFASEMKSLNEDCDKIIAFPPGSYYLSTTKETIKYYSPEWYSDSKNKLPSIVDENVKLGKIEYQNVLSSIRTSLENSVKKRLMSDVPYGVLLSGGLDSSLIASISVRARRDNATADDDDMKCINQINTSCHVIRKFLAKVAFVFNRPARVA